MPDRNPPPALAERQTALDRIAAAALLMLAALIPWAIAPVRTATALTALLTAVLIPRGGRSPRTPMDLPALAWALALLLSALLAEDRAASLPRLGKALFPALVGLTVFHARKQERGTRAVV